MAGVPYRGVQMSQDGRFADKQKKLKKKWKFPKVYSQKVDFKRINMVVLENWVKKRTTELLSGLEDEVLVGLIMNMLKADKPDPRELQINITGFLERNAKSFVTELWRLLTGTKAAGDIPMGLMKMETSLLLQKQKQDAAMQARLDHRFANMGSGGGGDPDPDPGAGGVGRPANPMLSDQRVQELDKSILEVQQRIREKQELWKQQNGQAPAGGQTVPAPS